MNLINKIAKTSFLAIITLLCSLIMILLGTTTAYAESTPLIPASHAHGEKTNVTQQSILGSSDFHSTYESWRTYLFDGTTAKTPWAEGIARINNDESGPDFFGSASNMTNTDVTSANMWNINFTSGALADKTIYWGTEYMDAVLYHMVIDNGTGYYGTDTSEKHCGDSLGFPTEVLSDGYTWYYDNGIHRGMWGYKGCACCWFDAPHPNGNDYTYKAYKGPVYDGKQFYIVLAQAPAGRDVQSLLGLVYEQPQVSTDAVDKSDNNKIILAQDSVTVTDTISYKYLEPKTVYYYYATVHYVNGEGITGTHVDGEEFTTSESGTGTFIHDFTFDSSKMTDGQQLTITCGISKTKGGDFVCSHNTNTSNPVAAETVTVRKPTIKTTLKDDDGLIGKSFGKEKDSFTDVVELTGLEEGQTYRIDGQLYDKTTGVLTSYTATSGKITTGLNETTKTVNVQFTDVNTINLRKHYLVCYETLTKIDGTTETVIAKHEDPTDTAQTTYIPIPEMSTKARTSNNGITSQEIIADPESVITDTITFKNIQPNIEYTITSQIINKTDKSVLATKTTKYTPTGADGTTGNSTTVTFSLNTSALKATDVLAVTTTLKTASGTLIAEHNKDLNNTEQALTIKRPAISTTAVDGIDKDKIIIKDPEAIIIDTVEYSNLIIGKPYTLNGKLYDKTTGKPFLDANGAEVTGTATFTPKAASDSQDVTFSFDITNMEIGSEDLSLVVFEDLYRGATLMVSHEDINDVDQTVAAHEPSIETTATDLVDSDKSVVRDPKSVIVDKVLYEGLVPGKTYTITGTLMDKSTGEELLINDEPVTKTIMFAPDSVNGFVTLRFEFDSSALEEDSVIVVFESLYREEKLITVHNDINDEEQSVTIIPPEIHTLATDTTDNDNIISGDIDTIINDKVMMTNLVPSFEYAYDGYQVLDNGVVMIYNEIPTTYIAEYYMTDDDDEETSYEKYQTLLKYANVPHGFYVLNTTDNTYDTCDKEGTINDSPTQVPADLFEAALDYEDAVIAGVYGYHVSVNYDADAKEITVNNDVDVYTADTLPVTVNAGKYSWDEETNKWVQAADSIVGGGSAVYDDEIMQQVISEHGERITQYLLNGSLVSKEDGKTIVAGDKEVTGSVGFTVDTAGVVTLNDGTEVPAEVVNVTEEILNAYSVANVVFEFDSTGVGDDASLVAFEELYSGDETVAEHKDLSDEDETVVVKQPSIGTKVVSVGGMDSKLIDAPNTSVQVVDTVSYENLVVGRTYSVSGVLMDKDTGSALLDDKGKEVIASTTFTADATSGSVEVPFSFSYDLDPGVKAGVVAFETLYRCDDDGKVTDTIVAEHKDWNDADQTLGWNDVADELIATGDSGALPVLLSIIVISGIIIIARKRCH